MGVQLTNPDPSKDANEVRQEQTKGNQNKQDGNILYQFFN